MFGKILIVIVVIALGVVGYEFYSINSVATHVKTSIVNGDIDGFMASIDKNTMQKNLQKRLLGDMKKTLDETVKSAIPEVQEEQIKEMANEIAEMVAKFNEKVFYEKMFKSRGFERIDNYTVLLPDLGTILVQNDINKFQIYLTRDGLGWKITNMGLPGDKFIQIIRANGF